MRKLLSVLLVFLLTLGGLTAFGETASGEKTLKILFTHDIHSYFDVAKALIGGEVREHGGAARLKTLIDENRDENTIYLDAGDFSMGTLLQAGFTTDAYELRLLGQLGCTAMTFGNHEFDCGAYGAAQMLESALASGDPLPQFVQSNMILTGELTDEQQALSDAMADYGAQEFTILEVNGLRVGVFGLLGIDGIECAPTSGVEFVNYIDAAKETVKRIQAAGADVIVCLSHAGTTGDGKNGEDFDLAKEVPEIDVIISGHSHSTYAEPVISGSTIVVSAGEYLTNLGALTLTVDGDAVRCADYRLIPCDDSVAEDREFAALYDGFKQNIQGSYLAAENCTYDQVIAHSGFDFMSLQEMYDTHQEYPTGNLIADAYMYEARRNGYDDIDVALVGLGTVRGSFFEGDITVSDAFEICSLGVGADGSAGHPLMACYATGEELKLLVELDASLGEFVSSIKMSYSGLRYTFNTKRMLLDRAYDIRLVRPDGSEEEIEDDKLYKVVANIYAANMLGMVNGLTKGILSIVPKNADGTPLENFYDASLRYADGREIKEWVALKNYLESFPEKNGIPTIPESYAAAEGRKVKVSEGGTKRIVHPGLTTIVMLVLQFVTLVAVILLLATRKKRWARRRAKKAARRAARALKG